MPSGGSGCQLQAAVLNLEHGYTVYHAVAAVVEFESNVSEFLAGTTQKNPHA